ncbi:class I SAM-dependent methyltransferase [soil metagenome]
MAVEGDTAGDRSATSPVVNTDARDDAADVLARLYDLDLEDDPGDLDLYRALAARTGGPVLELACGTGRVAAPLAADDLAVTGLDIDPAMLRRARRRWMGRREAKPGTGDLDLVEGDLLDARLGPRFALVILALNGLLVVGDPDGQAVALSTIARHLRPDGLAVLDVWLPSAEDLALYDGRVILEWLRHDSETGEQVAKLGSARHDSATATVELRAIFDAWPDAGGRVRRVAREDRLQLVGAAELVAMATRAGLVVEQLAGDYELSPFGPGAERAVLVGRLG